MADTIENPNTPISPTPKTRRFTATHGLLSVLILLVLGFGGYYVYHTNHDDDSLNKASVTGSNSQAGKLSDSNLPATKATRYFTIQEWGVQAPYAANDSDTYTNTLDETTGTEDIASARLAKEDADCKEVGAGSIGRFKPEDPVNDEGTTASADAAKNPSMYKLIGSYYYSFAHSQAACGDHITAESQNKANDAVKAMFSKLEAVPGSIGG